MKTCNKCGFTGDESLFKKGANTCKQCYNKYMAEYVEKNRAKIYDINKKSREKHSEKYKVSRSESAKMRREAQKIANREEIKRLEARLGMKVGE
jgi:hypothetical protein